MHIIVNSVQLITDICYESLLSCIRNNIELLKYPNNKKTKIHELFMRDSSISFELFSLDAQSKGQFFVQCYYKRISCKVHGLLLVFFYTKRLYGACPKVL